MFISLLPLLVNEGGRGGGGVGEQDKGLQPSEPVSGWGCPISMVAFNPGILCPQTELRVGGERASREGGSRWKLSRMAEISQAQAWGVECLPGMQEALGSIPSTA